MKLSITINKITTLTKMILFVLAVIMLKVIEIIKDNH
jgi:hypothetical protein